jgi:hypothetical protein
MSIATALEKTPLRLKALLIELLTQHQKVDPTFHLLPTDDKSTAGAITKATEIPNNEEMIKQYVKEMHDVENRNNDKYYTVVFYIKVASSMTLGTMKKDNGLFLWLRNNNIWIRSYHFTTTYDVVNAGFISHMNGGLHNRDRINGIIQASLKEKYPNLEVKLVPTTIKHGLEARTKRITHVVSCQADCKHLTEAREALVTVFKHSATKLPKDIFFVPSPANGMITSELYYKLVDAHHEHMANIRSFAIVGIAKMNTPMNAQVDKDTNSLVETTFERIILDARVPETNKIIFSSIEPTSLSNTDGRYLLLTDKTKLGAAEHVIDELIKYIAINPNLKTEIAIAGEDVRRANRIKVSKAFYGYTDFLVSKVPTVITTNPAQNAWTKHCEPTRMDYTNENFPSLDSRVTLDYANNPFAATDKLREIAMRELGNKKARFSNDETNTIRSCEN